MASPYTQDITQSKVYKKITGNKEEKTIDKILNTLTEFKALGDSNIADNIKELQDSNTFEIQQKKNHLKNLNNISKITDTINTNYGGNVAMWAMDYAKNDFENSVFSSFPMDEITNKKLELQPDEAYGDILKQRAKNIENRYNNIINKLDDEGISYRDLEKGETFIDKEYQNVYDSLTKQNSFNVIKGIGSLFKGQGFNYTDAAELKRQFNENIANSKVSMLESINDEFKALYALSPKLAGDYKEAVKNADVRREIVVKETDLKQGERFTEKGRKETYNYYERLITYTDREGNRKTQKERIETDAETVPQKGEINAHMLNLTLYTEEGKVAYRELMEEGFTPDAANEQIPLEQRISLEALQLKDFVAQNFDKLQQAIEDKYYTINAVGQKVEVFPGEKIPDERAYAAMLLNISEENVNVNNQISKSTFVVNSNLNEETQKFFETNEGIEAANQAKESLLPLNKEEEILIRYQNGEFDSALTPEGVYYGETKQIIDDPDTLKRFGFDKNVRIQVGVRLEDMNLVFTTVDEFDNEISILPKGEDKTRFEETIQKTLTESKEQAKLDADFIIATGKLKPAGKVKGFFKEKQSQREFRERNQEIYEELRRKYPRAFIEPVVFARMNPEAAQEIISIINNLK